MLRRASDINVLLENLSCRALIKVKQTSAVIARGTIRTVMSPAVTGSTDCARLRETAIVSDPEPARTGAAAMDEFDVAFEFMRTRLLADAI